MAANDTRKTTNLSLNSLQLSWSQLRDKLHWKFLIFWFVPQLSFLSSRAAALTSLIRKQCQASCVWQMFLILNSLPWRITLEDVIRNFFSIFFFLLWFHHLCADSSQEIYLENNKQNSSETKSMCGGVILHAEREKNLTQTITRC